MFSPISIRIHVVSIITVVMSYSSVISLIDLSINMAVLGPAEFGSSQNKYLGLLQ
jgi:hypothetical protein